MQDLSNFHFIPKLAERNTFRKSVAIFGASLIAFCLTTSAAMGQSPTFGETTQLFPQFVAGGGWTTYIALHNSTQQADVVTVELFGSDGSAFLNSTVALGANETKNVPIDSPSQTVVGWARLSSNGRFSATLLYQLIDATGLASEAG